ncbi:haloacid dehalogenase type II [Arthrobacter sp. UYEF36]|uniref:haloacid dehalogenase type II n=1 Tax=Arthrobacter sp. UYEF36 TaxID=1756366 RepID=UPI0033957091
MASAMPVTVSDVNETLSDMSPMAERCTEIGAPAQFAKLWFATLLRDGFALTASGDNGSFAAVRAAALRGLLQGLEVNRPREAAVEHVMNGMTGLRLHPDVPEGIEAPAAAGFRLITLSNGSARVAGKLFSEAGIRAKFESLLSAEHAPVWKPARTAYDYAAAVAGVDPSGMLLEAVHPWDIHGVARAGLCTAWLNRTGPGHPGYFEAPEFTVTALTELPHNPGGNLTWSTLTPASRRSSRVRSPPLHSPPSGCRPSGSRLDPSPNTTIKEQ